MTTVFLGLGSNQGSRYRHLQAAVERLARGQALWVREASPVYETEAHTLRAEETQPSFLNAVLRIETMQSPEALLRRLHEVEEAEGRRRSQRRWAPRSLDVDLLAYGSLVRETEEITLPHPRLARRGFVLRPWADLAPNFVVPPPFDRSVQGLLTQCPDATAIKRTAYVLAIPRTALPQTGS